MIGDAQGSNLQILNFPLKVNDLLLFFLKDYHFCINDDQSPYQKIY